MKVILVILFVILSGEGFARFGKDDDHEALRAYQKECFEIASALEGRVSTNCFLNYHHYNPGGDNNYSPKKARAKGEVTIAQFNALHPGMAKTRFKDYRILAQMINQWDVVAVTELLPLLSDDIKFNKELQGLINETPKLIEQLQKELGEEAQKNLSENMRINILESGIARLKEDLKGARRLYRLPGYIRILQELMNIPGGKEWSLILSPRGDGAKSSDVQELVGFFYRSSLVKPRINPFCKRFKKIGDGRPYACLPSMGPEVTGRDLRPLFSRRPFIGSFKSNKLRFTLLASHVIFNSPTGDEQMNQILQGAFGVNTPSEVGPGVNKQNYARFAEVKLTLELMNMMREKFKTKNLIFAADMNLESSIKAWPTILSTFPKSNLYIHEKTTLSEKRFLTSNQETFGESSNYDHFIFRPTELTQCLRGNGELNGGVDSLMRGMGARLIEDQYLVRLPAPRGPYEVNKEKSNRLLEYLKDSLSHSKSYFKISRITLGECSNRLQIPAIVEDSKSAQEYVDDFQRRIIDSQLQDDTYYSVYRDIISDHSPIFVNCKNHKK
jgi:hypothetical protein